MTKAEAKRIIEQYKNYTSYFDGKEGISYNDMFNLFRRYGFGNAEAKVIIASMVLAGAKFK